MREKVRKERERERGERERGERERERERGEREREREREREESDHAPQRPRCRSPRCVHRDNLPALPVLRRHRPQRPGHLHRRLARAHAHRLFCADTG